MDDIKSILSESRKSIQSPEKARCQRRTLFDSGLWRVQKIFGQRIFHQRNRNVNSGRLRKIIQFIRSALWHRHCQYTGKRDFKLVYAPFEEDPTKDLNNDPIINQTMSPFLSELCYKYVIYLSLSPLITTKHLSINKNASIIKEHVNGRTAHSSTDTCPESGRVRCKQWPRLKIPNALNREKNSRHNKKIGKSEAEITPENKIYKTVT